MCSGGTRFERRTPTDVVLGWDRNPTSSFLGRARNHFGRLRGVRRGCSSLDLHQHGPPKWLRGRYTPEGAPLTGTPYAFGNEIQDCESIESITVTLTLFDGDTGDPNELDFNDLTLGLDGIDTVIPLNGFPEIQTVTNTISGVPNNADRILAALKADGQLEGTILDSTPNDNLVGIPATFDTTLQIKCGIAEEPGAGAATPYLITQEKEQEAESGDVTQTAQIENE